jgi:hypothetical protein
MKNMKNSYLYALMVLTLWPLLNENKCVLSAWVWFFHSKIQKIIFNKQLYDYYIIGTI